MIFSHSLLRSFQVWRRIRIKKRAKKRSAIAKSLWSNLFVLNALSSIIPPTSHFENAELPALRIASNTVILWYVRFSFKRSNKLEQFLWTISQINSLSYFLEKFVHEDLYGVMCSKSNRANSLVNGTVQLFANVTCANDKVYRDHISLFKGDFNCLEHLTGHREGRELTSSSPSS
jgi:hypothetical protein